MIPEYLLLMEFIRLGVEIEQALDGCHPLSCCVLFILPF